MGGLGGRAFSPRNEAPETSAARRALLLLRGCLGVSRVLRDRLRLLARAHGCRGAPAGLEIDRRGAGLISRQRESHRDLAPLARYKNAGRRLAERLAGVQASDRRTGRLRVKLDLHLTWARGLGPDDDRG